MESVALGPKELLPVGERTVLEHVIDEANSAGVGEIVIVLSPSKPELIQFATQYETAIQEVAGGLAPAIVCGNRLEPSLVLLPDTIFFPASPSCRLVQYINRGFDIAIAVQLVDDAMVSRYGIVEWNAESGRITRILEKPSFAETPSRWAIAARFGLSARTLLFLRDRVAGYQGDTELDLPPLLNDAIAAGYTAMAVPVEENEQRLDCGSPEGYRHACEVVGASF